MANNNSIAKKTSSLLNEIENRLEKIVSDKKGEIEKRLEEIIRKEKEKAEKEVKRIEREFDQEKETLINYQGKIAEFESTRSELDGQLKQHLGKAVQLKTEIESLSTHILEEFGKIEKINRTLEELSKIVEEKALSLKENLEEKFGIAVDIPKALDIETTDLDIENEIKEWKLTRERLAKAMKSWPRVEAPKNEKEVEDVDNRAEKVEKRIEEEPPAEQEDIKEEEAAESEMPEEEEEEEEETAEEELTEEKEEISPPEVGEDPRIALETLEKYRESETTKDKVEISYYQNKDIKILDNEYLMTAFKRHLEKAQKLFEKLSQIESLKDQFIVKREIVTHQENLRKIVGGSVEMLEEGSWKLPQFTSEIVNIDILTDILEKLTHENWSNYLDFIRFCDSIEKMENSFYDKIDPPSDYLNSIIKELKI